MGSYLLELRPTNLSPTDARQPHRTSVLFADQKPETLLTDFGMFLRPLSSTSPWAAPASQPNHGNNCSLSIRNCLNCGKLSVFESVISTARYRGG